MTASQQAAVEDIDRLGGRVLALIDVRKVAAGNRLDAQRHAGLGREPFEHQVPRSVLKVEGELARGANDF